MLGRHDFKLTILRGHHVLDRGRIKRRKKAAEIFVETVRRSWMGRFAADYLTE